MSYRSQLSKAAQWLVLIRNSDNGWGLTTGQASSIVNTAEAIFVLERMHSSEYDSCVAEGLKFLESKTLSCLNRNPNTRYAFFSILGVVDHQKDISHEFLQDVAGWLLKARNKDGAWGHAANDEQSKTYPTVMSILALHALGKIDNLTTATNWLETHAAHNGWSFSPGDPVCAAATAQATLALLKFKGKDDNIFTKPKELLLMTSLRGVEAENMPGTPWSHHNMMWVTKALTALGVEPYSKPIAEGVRDLNQLNSESGWKEPNGHLTVRGQYWAVATLHNIQSAFDPSVHTYQIDSALASAELREPDFVRINVHKKWSFAVPRLFYQTATYGLIIFSLVFFFGLHRLVSRNMELLLAVVCFITAFWMSHKRPTLFNKWLIASISFVIMLLSVIDLVFGISVSQLFDMIGLIFQASQNESH